MWLIDWLTGMGGIVKTTVFGFGFEDYWFWPWKCWLRSSNPSLLICWQEEGIADVNEMIQSERPQSDRRLREVLSDLGTACSRYLTLNQGRSGATTGRTRLDIERLKMCQREIVRRAIHSILYSFANSPTGDGNTTKMSRSRPRPTRNLS